MPKVTILDLPVTKRLSYLPQNKHQSTKFNAHFCAHVHRLTIIISPNLAKNRGTNPSSCVWIIIYILKMMGERRCIQSVYMPSFTAGAQLTQVCDYREPKDFSPMMEHYAVHHVSDNMMKMPTHFQFIFHLGKEGNGCEEQLSSPTAMQQWQDGPTPILEAAGHVYRFSKTVSPRAQIDLQTELNQKSSILHTQILTVQLCQLK